MIGIYKITSPTGKIYIGQSINIKKRFKEYSLISNCKSQTRLYRSLKKYGSIFHKFEIVCECEIHELNDKERYYQDLFSATGKKGLNCRATHTKDKSGYLSEETKLNVSKSKTGKNLGLTPWNKGKKCPQISKGLQGKMNGSLNPNYGKKASEYNKLMSSLANKGKKPTESVRLSRGGTPRDVICLNTGIFYRSYVEAAFAYGLNAKVLSERLSGRCQNKTSLRYA